jgi:hypothetical protein
VGQETVQKKKSFVAFVQESLGELTTLPPFEQAPDKYIDWGTQEYFKVKTAKGECAA